MNMRTIPTRKKVSVAPTNISTTTQKGSYFCCHAGCSAVPHRWQAPPRVRRRKRGFTISFLILASAPR
jgi:hypothetical protein